MFQNKYKTFRQVSGLFFLILVAAFTPLAAEESGEAKQNLPLVHEIEENEQLIKNLAADYNKALSVLWPKQKNDSSVSRITLRNHMTMEPGSTKQYLLVETVSVSASEITVNFSKTKVATIFETGRDKNGADKTAAFTQERILRSAGNGVENLEIIYQSNLGTKISRKLSEIKEKNLRSEILRQYRDYLLYTQRNMERAIELSKRSDIDMINLSEMIKLPNMQ